MIELLLNAESALDLGLLDDAERIYRTVLQTDPRNGIATVGLSRVALERGDEGGAHALAEEALEIDPENATARRMIDRLEEVDRHRDAAVSGRWAGAGASPDASGRTVGAGAPLAVSGRWAGAGAPPDVSGRTVGAEVPPDAGATAARAAARVPHPPDDAQPSSPKPTPPAAASQAARSRPGLLRRILRRS